MKAANYFYLNIQIRCRHFLKKDFREQKASFSRKVLSHNSTGWWAYGGDEGDGGGNTPD